MQGPAPWVECSPWHSPGGTWGWVACANGSFWNNMEHWITGPSFLIPTGWRGPWLRVEEDLPVFTEQYSLLMSRWGEEATLNHHRHHLSIAHPQGLQDCFSKSLKTCGSPWLGRPGDA